MTESSNNDCLPWLERVVMSPSTTPVQFQQSTGDDLNRFVSNGELVNKFLEMIKDGNMTEAWKPWATSIVENLSVKFITLCIFLHIGVDANNNLIPFQADVNGKRFIPTTQNEAPDETKSCNALVVPYQFGQENEVESDDSDDDDDDILDTSEGRKSACQIVPMTYQGTKSAAASRTPRLPARTARTVDAKDILKVFDILFQQRPGNVKNMAPIKIFAILVLCIDHCFDLKTIEGWMKLLVAMGRHAWGRDWYLRLNDLALEERSIPSFALALFSSMIPLKLGFLSGDSFVAQVHSNLLQGRGMYSNLATTQILQPKPAKLSRTGMKFISNQQITEDRGNHITGSALDFFLEILLDYEMQQNNFCETEAYLKQDVHDRIEHALGLLVEAAMYNPHIKKVLDSFLHRRIEQGCKDVDWKSSFVKQYKSNFHKVHAFEPTNKKQLSKDLAIFVMILIDFRDQKGAKALGKFLQQTGVVSIIGVILTNLFPICPSHLVSSNCRKDTSHQDRLPSGTSTSWSFVDFGVSSTGFEWTAQGRS